MYQVEITYGKHSAYYGNGGASLDSAQAHLAQMRDFYAEDGVTGSRILQICDTCCQGRITRCPCPKKHRNGYHGSRCYKPCPTCRGTYQTICP